MGGNLQSETGVDDCDRDRSLTIIKGKRTKRQRTLSPCGIGTTTSSSSTSGGGGSAGGGDCDLYPSSSSGMTVFGGADEEEDMAYCLILLARGPVKWREEEDRGSDERTEDDEFMGSSKKFSEVATTGGAMTKAGFYVYECKTCSRTFPSFQALGGHRASHKKPKLTEDPKKATSEPNSDEDIDDERRFRKIAINSPAPVASSISFPAKLSQPTKPKIHECSICGSEFSSGQALGGHMRRHRTVVTPAAMIANHNHSSLQTSIHGSTSRLSPVLSLDLNLPAPEDDPKFQFTSTPPQKPMLFTAPALVDCHY